VKPKLLVVELWDMGDMIIATPFLRAACERFSVTLVCKPPWQDLRSRFWPDVNVIPFLAPWTAFKHKYRLYAWPWFDLLRLRKLISRGQFDVGLSAHAGGDPRDHLLLALAHVKERIGFPRMGSKIFLTRPLERPDPASHRYEYWRVLGDALGLDLPAREKISLSAGAPAGEEILIHTGAKQSVRVWPLERFRALAARLRRKNFRVQVACNPDQRDWWLQAGEKNVVVPQTIIELLAVVDRALLFIGNDSGPGHLAAMVNVPTFTLFGPQLPEWFAPLHPDSEWIEGKPCPYKPCSDYCYFPSPHCLQTISEEEVWQRVENFVARCAPGQSAHLQSALT
jgi:ADP-heptose:LPS heptosyltransferase